MGPTYGRCETINTAECFGDEQHGDGERIVLSSSPPLLPNRRSLKDSFPTGQQLPRILRDIEFGQNLLPSRATHFHAQRAVIQQSPQGTCDLIDVSRRSQYSGNTIFDELWNTADARGNDRHLELHGLRDRGGCAIAVAVS